ncbi:HAD family hydrolase [Oleidesulfovibrio sp.]|uniref:HAD family hydrolase n=1 Tax=Oleidesulfovibrio sp. TaxID=2909707 RepID=UPI003A8B60B1
MPDAVIFDMDGVLIDSEPMHNKIQAAMAMELGIKITTEESKRFTGMSTVSIWQQLCSKHSLSLRPEQLAAEQGKRYLDLALASAKPQEGILPLLDYFSESGVPLAVASSGKREIVEAVLNQLQITEYFSAVVSSDDCARSKPWPDIFLRAAQLLNTLPADCLVIEDAANGVAAARAAGMRCIGLSTPHGVQQDLSAADCVATSVADIKSIITNHCFRCG